METIGRKSFRDGSSEVGKMLSDSDIFAVSGAGTQISRQRRHCQLYFFKKDKKVRRRKAERVFESS